MDHWKIIKQQAQKYLLSGDEWNSFVFDKRYRVLKISKTNLTIEKVTGGKPVTISSSYVNSMVSKIIAGKEIKRSDSVARAATVVGLHPCILWDRNNKKISWNEVNFDSLEQTKIFINEASDDEISKIQTWINQRKYQAQFRKNLLKVFDNKCPISYSKINDLLQAAHIYEHSKSRDNSSANGIVLRADLHILFDRNLLLIHPQKLTIHLHQDLLKSEYKIYQGHKIILRSDGSNPSIKYLIDKWNLAGWVKPIGQ